MDTSNIKKKKSYNERRKYEQSLYKITGEYRGESSIVKTLWFSLSICSALFLDNFFKILK